MTSSPFICVLWIRKCLPHHPNDASASPSMSFNFYCCKSISFVSNIFWCHVSNWWLWWKIERKEDENRTSIEREKDKISQSIRNWTNMTFEILMVFIFFFFPSLGVFVSHRTGKERKVFEVLCFDIFCSESFLRVEKILKSLLKELFKAFWNLSFKWSKI